MPKIKTHKGTAKVLKVRKSGKVKIYCPGSRHNTGSKNAKFNRKNRKGNSISKRRKKDGKSKKWSCY